MSSKKEYLTRKEIMEIVKAENKEMFKCFNKLVNDLNEVKRSQERVERVLLGDADFHDDGLVKRLNPVITHYENWDSVGNWDVLCTLVEKYKAIKWFTVLLSGGAAVGVFNIILEIIKILEG